MVRRLPSPPYIAGPILIAVTRCVSACFDVPIALKMQLRHWQVAACQGQDCGDGQGGREGLWDTGDIRAGDGRYVRGFVGAVRRHGAFNGGS